MFGIGFSELILIIIIAVIFIGPEKLPEIARTLGKAYTEIRRAGNEMKRSVAEEARASGLKDVVSSVTRDDRPARPDGGADGPKAKADPGAEAAVAPKPPAPGNGAAGGPSAS